MLNETNVRVYWNLHKHCWSVQNRKTGRVVRHVQACTLADVKFVVRPPTSMRHSYSLKLVSQ